uniref:ubiquitin-like-specific protease 1A n=1 Tax=Fragaria vesca subsp. vesca TaxID=101020 RepID=UPI0005C9025E|nr:PREDICTED: ubiquitin-like-specific protease 1A [Fragaria vesca subsp. vesca]
MGKNVEKEASCQNIEKQRDEEKIIDLTDSCKNVEKEASWVNVQKQKDEEKIIDLTDSCKNVEKEASCQNVEKQREEEKIIDLTDSCKNVEKEAPCKNVYVEKQKVREFKIDVIMDVDDEAVLDYVYNGVGSELILVECNGQSCKRARTLLPNTWLNDEVVTIFASYLLASSTGDNVYFHTFFSNKLKSYCTYEKPVGKVPTPKKMWVKSYSKYLPHCKKMFIPIHDSDHWYVFVVCIDNETGEYWLNVFDIIFGHLVKKTKKFEDFPIFKPPQCPKQEGTDDCGIFTIKHMEQYDEE